MIALFDEPVRVTISGLEGIGTVGMLLGMAVKERMETVGVVCLEDGKVTELPLSVFTIDWRYEVTTDSWLDLNHQTDQPVSSD